MKVLPSVSQKPRSATDPNRCHYGTGQDQGREHGTEIHGERAYHVSSTRRPSSKREPDRNSSVLAVLSCLSDRATEGVLQLAKTADPEGVRTVGVLTKADLVTEQAVVQTIVQLVKGDTLKLGYYIVRNRGADEDSLSIAECQMKEREKLAESLWAELGTMGRTGVAALRAELQILLTELAKRELPKQRLEIEQRLSKCREKLDSMGPSRDTSASQRECLIRLASKFERIVRDALDGRYEGNSLFSKHVELKLATEIRVLNEGFSELMWQKGHSWKFVAESSREPTQIAANYEKRAISIIQSSIISSIQELRHLVGKTVHYRAPSSESIMGHIEKYYEESRGPELGTVCVVTSWRRIVCADRIKFGGSLLAMIFRAQASQWRNIVIIHVGVVSAVVHRFITTLLSETFGDQRMRDELYKSVLAQRLQTAYAQAKRQAKFLLDIELNGRPSTYNHYFTDNLQKARNARMTQGVRDSPRPGFEPAANKSNTEQVKEDIHDILKSYYKVSRKRFVDAICRQAIEYFLLDGSVSPLKVLSPELIATLTDSQLDMIAGEDVTTRRERECLGSEIQGLRAAMKVLQG